LGWPSVGAAAPRGSLRAVHHGQPVSGWRFRGRPCAARGMGVPAVRLPSPGSGQRPSLTAP